MIRFLLKGVLRDRGRSLFPLITVAVGVFAAWTNIWVGLVSMFVVGAGITVIGTGVQSLMQNAVAGEMRGRVMSLYTLVWGGVFPFGAFLVGAMSEGWGVSMALLVNGTAGLAGLAAILAWWRRRAPDRAAGPGATAR